MRIVPVLLATLIVTGALQVHSQKKVITATPRVVVVDSSVFSDSNTGIRRLVEVKQSMGFVDCSAGFRYARMTSQINEKMKEIADLECKGASTDEIKRELSLLNQESWKADEENKNCLRVARKERLEPILQKIQEKLKEYGKLRNYQIIVGSKSEDGFPLYLLGQFDDVTYEFIDYFNSFDPGKIRN